MAYITLAEFKTFVKQFPLLAGADLQDSQFTIANQIGESMIHMKVASKYDVPFVMANLSVTAQNSIKTLSYYATLKTVLDMAFLRILDKERVPLLEFITKTLNDLASGDLQLPGIISDSLIASARFDIETEASDG
jgi:hypothetical protein